MYLAIDIGGTKTRVDLFSDINAASLFGHYHFNTPSTPAELLNSVNAFLSKNAVGVKAIILGLPGVLNKEKTLLQKLQI